MKMEKMMIIKVLGSGGAFSQKWGNTQLFLDTGDPDTSILFDCGEQFTWHLHRNPDFNISKIKNIYITHAHSDHIGGLSTLALMFYFYPNLLKFKPNLIGRREILKNIWNGYLRFNLSTLAYNQLPDGRNETNIDDFFNVVKISENQDYQLGQDMLIKPIQTMHVVNSSDFIDSFGLMVYHEDKKIFITGDTQFAPYQMIGLYDKADIIIHDCETGGKDMFETPFESGVHAHISKLATLPIDIRNKMYLIHYGENITREHNDMIIEKGFKGFLYQGDSITI
jgi:ribonuclease BN (tRNA processing enzyme)